MLHIDTFLPEVLPYVNPIKTLLKTLGIHKFFKSDGVSFFAVLGLALALIAIKGAGASTILHTAFSNTIEETAASAQTLEPSQNQLQDINSLTGHGMETSLLKGSLATVQESALISRTSVLTTLVDDGSDRTETSSYEVQDGDTISGIATDFGISVQTLLMANNIKNADAIKPGTELRIPPIDGVLYTVKKGDTVGGLAAKFKANVDKIIAFNGLPLAGDLHAGDEIVIPDGVLTADRNAGSGNTASAKNISNAKFAGLPKIEGYFMTPASCVITQLFHVRNGIDCANKKGTPIYAAAAGTVNLVQLSNRGYGNMVRITHDNGTETLYGHFSKIYVKEGQAVGQGDPLGEMGNSGRSTGPHLHFEIHGAYNILARYGLRGVVVAGQ